MSRLPEEIRRKYQNTEKSSETRAEKESKLLNLAPGDLRWYDCHKCLNRGFIYVPDGDYVVTRDCDCMGIRQSIRNIERSGIKQQMDKCTFDTFKATEPWQKALLNGAKQFMHDHDNKWFFAGGQVGCGKTHICTAICGAFLNAGMAVKYMLWRDEIVRIKAVANDDDERQSMILPLKKAPVLYIDDFFKTVDEYDQYGNVVKKKPTAAEMSVAFEIINYRYGRRDLITVISTERSVDDLLSCDEAVGSRIYERAKEYGFYFQPDRAKNYRLR